MYKVKEVEHVMPVLLPVQLYDHLSPWVTKSEGQCPLLSHCLSSSFLSLGNHSVPEWVMGILIWELEKAMRDAQQQDPNLGLDLRTGCSSLIPSAHKCFCWPFLLTRLTSRDEPEYLASAMAALVTDPEQRRRGVCRCVPHLQPEQGGALVSGEAAATTTRTRPSLIPHHTLYLSPAFLHPR